MPNQQEDRLPAVVADRLLEIPDYQRPYAWGEKQLEDLWEDLDLLGPIGTHYAGTLVVRHIQTGASPKTSMDDEGTTLRHTEVVDGQQRLTTCFLLLDRVRRRLDGLDAAGVETARSIARNIRHRYGFVRINNVAVPRLKLGADLNSYWTSVVLGEEAYVGPGLLVGERRLRDAADFFDTKLDHLADGVSDAEQFTRLKELHRRVSDGLGFLVYEVGSVGEVGVIFETLNERGRPLSDLEKTKNYLLYLARHLPDARNELLAEKINTAWSGIFRNLADEADLDDQLLRAHWLATENPDRNAWKRIASIKQRFDRGRYLASHSRLIPDDAEHDQEAAWDRLFDDVSKYVKSLLDCSFFLAEMFDPHAPFEAFGSEDDRRIARLRSAALRRSGVVALYRPLLFASRLSHPSDGALYSQLVDLCERYTARVFIIEQKRTNAGEPRLLRLAHDLHQGRDPQEILGEVRATLWRYAPDERVRATMESADENWYWRRGHKYFLYEYERSLLGANEELPPLSTFTEAKKEQRTTEHILPQHPDEKAECWWSRFSEEDHAALCHSLGNLMLTLDNSSYSNKCFDQKRGAQLVPGEEPRPCYAQGKLHQERLLANTFSEWTPDSVRDRQHALADWAMERWAVEPPEGTALVDESEEIEAEGTQEDVAALAALA